MKKRKKTNDEVIFECYRRMFKEAEPSADFDELHEKGITKQREFFMSYFLSSENYPAPQSGGHSIYYQAER